MKEIKRLEKENSVHIIYEVNNYTVIYNKYEWGIQIGITPDFKFDYLPEIYFDNDLLGEKPTRFRIQTTSYGALEVEEIDKVVEGYRIAQKTVKEIVEFFGL